jgi:hypothetical protein
LGVRDAVVLKPLSATPPAATATQQKKEKKKKKKSQATPRKLR